MQALREKKQQYLRDQILDQNYDPNEFMDFCETSIGKVDIDDWTFEQLVQIVQDFITAKTRPGLSGATSDNKLGLDSDIANEFNQWDMHIQQSTPKSNEPKFELNPFDLDFLDVMAGGSKPVSSGPAATTAQGNKNAKNNYMSVPSDIVKKLQQNNDGFIMAFNALSLQSKPKTLIIVQQKPQQVPNYSQLAQLSTVANIQEKRQSPAQQNYKEQFSSITNQKFSKTIACKKIINKSRLSGNEDVVISGHEIVNPNVFVPKYVLFFVTINPHNIEVKRRLKDFESLRTLLKKFFPTTQIPHLERCSRLSETEPAIIKKQTLFLESFLNNLIMKKDLKCKLLQQFLLCKDLDLLKKIFKEYEKLSGPKSLQTLFSPSGQIQLKMNSQNRKFLDEQINLNSFMQEHFTKMKGLYDTLLQGFQANVKTIGEIEQMHRLFKERVKAINVQFTPEYQVPSLQRSLDRVMLMHKQWGVSLKTQVRIIQSQIRHLYRYEQDNVNTMNQLLKFEEDFASSFAKRSDKDQANRDQYQSKRLQQFKTNLEGPSKNVTVLKHQVAYLQEKASQEGIEYLRDVGKKLDRQFGLFSTLQHKICQDMESVWKGFESYYR